MAQRTGAERFLAPPAKTASAGAALALAVAALLLCGCGGGSSTPEAASSSSTQAASTAPTAGATKAGSAEDSPKQAGARSAAQQAKEAAPGHASAASAAAKKHAPIAQPKGKREQAPTAAEKASATVADMSLQSPSLPAPQGTLAALSAPYTCDGQGSSPALRWAGVPADSKELILYVMNAQPLEGKLFFDWAVAGLDPHSEGLEAGRLPKGAVVGTNSFGKPGYEICPAPGSAETYIFALFALPRALAPKAGFDPRPLREEILAVSGDVGLLSAVYSRG